MEKLSLLQKLEFFIFIFFSLLKDIISKINLNRLKKLTFVGNLKYCAVLKVGTSDFNNCKMILQPQKSQRKIIHEK
jgi:hypothetical protein